MARQRMALGGQVQILATEISWMVVVTFELEGPHPRSKRVAVDRGMWVMSRGGQDMVPLSPWGQG